MKKAAFYTLGCKVNQYETEAISGLFEKEGYRVVDFEEKADVYVINTCTVTNLSDRKSRQMIRRAKRNNENSIVVVTGCYAQTAPEEVINIPGVNMIIGTKERNKIVELVRKIESNRDKLKFVDDIMKARNFEELRVDTYKGRTRAFIKIQEGCSQFCAYCIVPYARGPVRSRQPEEILQEVRKLADCRFKEIVLTGIHIASYGKDIKNTSLPDIMKKVHEIDGIERIRLGSIEPATVTDEFLETAGCLNKLCPHFHISLQSGCDKILKRMNRKYTVDEYRRITGLLRKNVKDVAITTDIMVGFPGETDEDFEQTYKFADEISFAKIHVFKYSPRKGTPAASYNDQVPSGKKEMRSDRLIELSRIKTLEFNNMQIGRVLPVLFEQEANAAEKMIEGLTANYVRVLCKGNTMLKGRIMNTELLKAEKEYIIGQIAGQGLIKGS